MVPPLSLMALTVSELASRSFIQRACLTPMSPQSVLSFFFGVDYLLDNGQQHKATMTEGKQVLETMGGIWYGSSEEYDKLCQAFIPTVRAAGNQELPPEEWNTSVDGVMSQVLLCDQLSRNCFRGTEEAFQYDSVALTHTLRLVDEFFILEEQQRTLPGAFYPPYIAFLLTPLMHSEDVSNLNKGFQVLDTALKKSEGQAVCDNLDSQRAFLVDHKQVLDRFGRYPHRNTALRRSTTTEEQVWLDDRENLPGWAKSQG